jgi:hypothetical protein
LLFWNGERTEGTRFPTQAGIGIRAIFAGSSSDLFVGAEGGRIFRFDGSTWTREVISTNPPNAILSIHRGLTGPPVAAGSGGVLLRRSLDAGVWTPIALSPGASPSFRRVFVAEPYVLAMTEGGAVYRGPVGSSQLSLLASAPATPIGEVQAGAFSGDGGLAFLAASVAASVRVLVLDLRELTPVWRPFASYASLAAVSALEVDGDRVLVAGNTGNVAVLTLDGDGGAEVSRVPVDPSDSFRSVVVLGREEVLLGGTGGVMGFLGRDGGAWQLASSDFSGNRRETLNDGCAVTASVAGSPVVHVTTNNNGVGTRSTRWGWVTGGLAQNGFDWTACHLTDPQRAWVIGNNRRQSGAGFSRMLTRRGSAWVDADPGISSEDWASVTGLPDGTTYFLVNGSVVVINRDGGTAPEAFEAVALDGGPVHGLVALEQGRAAALQGAADAGIVWESNAGVTQWTWRVTNRPAPNELLAIHGDSSSGEARTLAVGAGGFFVENQSTGRVSGRLGSTDLTDVWVSRSLTAYIATAVDGGTSVGRTSPLVIIRASDGGARTEPVPVSQRIRGLFGVDDLDDVTRVWVTGSGGAILRRDFLPDGG